MSTVTNNTHVTVVFYFSIPLLSPFKAHISASVLTAGVSVIKDTILTSTWIEQFQNRGSIPHKCRVILSTRYMLCLRGFKRIFY